MQIRWNGAPIDSIPAEIRQAYDSLAWDVCQLHRKWGIFCRLFASGENMVELLNRSAAGFFPTYYDLLADDILLSISRLMDPKQTFGKDNLTFERLVHSIDSTKYTQLKRDIERRLSNARDKCAFTKDQRNKRIAHSDLATKLLVNPLPSPTKTNIEEALESIRGVMNVVELYFFPPVYFQDVNIACVDYLNLTRDVDGARIIARLREAETCTSQLNSKIA